MIIYTRMSGSSRAAIGQIENPIKMIIEHESDLISKGTTICNTLFNIEKSNRYGETIVGGNEFSVFKATHEGYSSEPDVVRESFSKFIEHIQFTKEFAISEDMIEDANYGLAADAKRRAENFARAYYKTMDKICETSLIYGYNSTFSACGINISNSAPDDYPLFHSQHRWGHEDSDNYGIQSNFYNGNLFSTGDGVVNAAIFEESLYKLSVIMRNFKDENGEPLGYTADTIILPGNRPIAESIVKKVCGTYGTLASNTNEINLHYNNWNIVILPGWQTTDDRLMLMSSEANRNLCGNMFFNRVPLTISNWVDNHTGNYVWKGRCRFGIGYGSYKHMLLAVDSMTSLSSATPF